MEERQGRQGETVLNDNGQKEIQRISAIQISRGASVAGHYFVDSNSYPQHCCLLLYIIILNIMVYSLPDNVTTGAFLTSCYPLFLYLLSRPNGAVKN